MATHARRGARQDAEGVCGFLSDRTAIQTGVKGTGHPVEQADASGKSRRKTEERAAVRVDQPFGRATLPGKGRKTLGAEAYSRCTRAMVRCATGIRVRRPHLPRVCRVPFLWRKVRAGQSARSYGKSTRMSICSSSSPMPWTKLRCAILCRSWNMMGSKRWFPSRTMCPRPYPW